MATLLENGMQQFLDGNGAPVANGQVYFFVPNTQTPKATWQDVGQTILNTNPVGLDANGRALIYGAGRYRQMVNAADGSLIWDKEVQDLYALVNDVWCGTAGGTPNAIVLTPAQPVVALGVPLRLVFLAAASNTTATTINVSGLGAVIAKKPTSGGPIAMTGGEIITGNIYEAFYDGAEFLVSGTSLLATAAQINVWGGTTTGTANAQAMTTVPNFLTLVSLKNSPTVIYFIPSLANTGALTMNIDGLGALPVLKPALTGTPVALTGFELVPGAINAIAWDGTQLELISPLINQIIPPTAFVNKFRNGTFDIWQRGTTGAALTAGAGAVYTADGWLTSCAGANVTWSQGAALPTLPLTNFTLSLVGAVGVTATTIKQRIESLIATAFVGRIVTCQAKIFNNTALDFTPTITITVPTVADNYTGTTVVLAATNLQVCPAGAQTTVAYSYLVPAGAALGMELAFNFGAALAAVAAGLRFGEADIQIEQSATTGLNNNPPSPEMRLINFEQSFCERYLLAYRGLCTITTTVVSALTISQVIIACISFVSIASISLNTAVLTFRNKMRIAPTGISTSNVVPATSFVAASPDTMELSVSQTFTGGGAQTVSQLKINNANGFLLVTGAEI